MTRPKVRISPTSTPSQFPLRFGENIRQPFATISFRLLDRNGRNPERTAPPNYSRSGNKMFLLARY
jgi:hypothetical protein